MIHPHWPLSRIMSSVYITLLNKKLLEEVAHWPQSYSTLDMVKIYTFRMSEALKTKVFLQKSWITLCIFYTHTTFALFCPCNAFSVSDTCNLHLVLTICNFTHVCRICIWAIRSYDKNCLTLYLLVFSSLCPA